MHTAAHTYLIIDAQNCFMDLPAERKHLEELPVPGAWASAERTADFLTQAAARIGTVVVTLDSHASYGIERPGYWVNAQGQPLQPFTQVTLDDVRSGRVRTADPARADSADQVLERMAQRGRRTLMIWPLHGVLGTWGHNLADPIARALQLWETRQLRPALRVLKGRNPHTEHYSAVSAEVPLTDDPHTQVNHEMVQALADSLTPDARLFVSGQAGSHCVDATVRELVELRPALARHITLLEDTINPVPGFEAQQQALLDWTLAQGGEVLSVADALSRHSTPSCRA